MKKMVPFVLAVMIGVSLCAGGSKGSQVKNPEKAEKYRGYAKNYEKQATQAEEKGNAKLAAVLRQCAAAKMKIASGYESGDKSILNDGYKDYRKACGDRDKLKAADYEKCAANYETQAGKAEKDGKSDLAAALRQCAAAKKKIAKGMASGSWELRKEGSREYRAACCKKDELIGKSKKQSKCCK